MAGVQVELQRRLPDTSLVPWALNADGTDPVRDAAVLAQLDLTLSALRDALRGASSKTITDVVTALVGLTDGTQRAQLYDKETNVSAHVDMLRRFQAGQLERLFGDSYADGIGMGADAGAFPTTPTTSGSGSGSAANGQLTLRTGAATSSSLLRSNNIASFRTGTVMWLQTGVRVPVPTTFRVVSRKAGVDTQVAAASFSVVPNYAPDGNFHRYEIGYQGSSCNFFADGACLHRMSGQISTPRTGTLDLPIAQEVFSDASTATARWGMYTTTDGYFFEAVYAVVDLSMNVRGTSIFRTGAVPDAQIKPLSTLSVQQFNVGTSAVRITSIPLPNRRTVSLKSLPSNANNTIIYIGTSGGVSAANGYPLSVGDAVDIELADVDDTGATTNIWAIGSTAGLQLAVMEVS